jgi:hypothetical protein
MKALCIVAVMAALAVAQSARADECGDAVRDYNAVLPRLNEATQKFSNCVAESLGRDVCAREFAGVRSAYSQFQAAVAIYKKQCG